MHRSLTLGSWRRLADLYDTKLLARHLPAVFEGDTSLGQVYGALVGGDKRQQARVCRCLETMAERFSGSWLTHPC